MLTLTLRIFIPKAIDPEFGRKNILTIALDSNLTPALKIRQEPPAQTNVPIAAAVTAYSRMIINDQKLQAIAEGLELYYSDTDSLVVNGPLPSNLIHDTELGLLKLEHKIREGYFVAPKIYWFETEEGEIITRCKGYPGNLTREQITALYEGKSLDLLVQKWSRSIEQGKVNPICLID